MKVLILGGTGFLGWHLTETAVRSGHEVSCLARGVSGPVPEGARLISVDRTSPAAFDGLRGSQWDAVVELSWQPGLVAAALQELAPRAAHWTYVSSVSAYATHDTDGADEHAPLLTPTPRRVADREVYGEAKVACALLCTAMVSSPLLVARAGLIGGPGDTSDRSGYWVARAARSRSEPMLVPDASDASTQVIDARDLSSWLIGCAESGVSGTFNAVGPPISFADWIRLSREVGRHQAGLVAADPAWLASKGTSEYAGPRSFPLWVDESKGRSGWSRRSGAAAAAAGLRNRPVRDLITDVLGWERTRGLDRDRSAGIALDDERRLIHDLLLERARESAACEAQERP